MDEIRIESMFTKKLIAKLLEKSIAKKYGCTIKLKLDDFNMTVINGDAKVHLSAEAEIPKNEIERMLW